MGERINISFKDTDIDKEILKFLREESKLLGVSTYIKQLIYKEMLRENNPNK